jgi:hypothetical protein
MAPRDKKKAFKLSPHIAHTIYAIRDTILHFTLTRVSTLHQEDAMSTKSTLRYGPTFHLYEEAFDSDNVYLSIKTKEFELSNGAVTVAIPAAIWEVIRQARFAETDMANMTLKELHAYVEQEVDLRIDNFQKAPASKKLIHSLAGSMCYGGPDTPRADQIARGLDYHQSLRKQQFKIQRAIKALEKLNQR